MIEKPIADDFDAFLQQTDVTNEAELLAAFDALTTDETAEPNRLAVFEDLLTRARVLP